MKKRLTIISLIILLIVIITIIVYIFLQNYYYYSNPWVGTISKILEYENNNIVLLVDYEGKDFPIGFCTFSLKNVPIKDSNGNKKDIFDLNVGDIIEFVVKDKVIEASSIPHLDKVKQVKILKKDSTSISN